MASRRGPLAKTCEACGKEFTCFPCDYNRRRFCSIRCKAIGTQTRIKITCVVCGEQKVVTPSRSQERHCSKKCEGRARMEPMDKKIIRLRVVIGDCWLWTGRLNPKGYGVTALPGGKTILAHRASYRAFRGQIPKGKFVCHTCDTPTCVNPAHLFIGSAQENTNDMIKKRRIHLSIPRPIIDAMRDDYATGSYSKAEIARKYGRHRTHVGRILRGEARYAY